MALVAKGKERKVKKAESIEESMEERMEEKGLVVERMVEDTVGPMGYMEKVKGTTHRRGCSDYRPLQDLKYKTGGHP